MRKEFNCNKYQNIEELLAQLETLRIDVDLESFGEPIETYDKYLRTNDMLDDCISIVKKFFNKDGELFT